MSYPDDRIWTDDKGRYSSMRLLKKPIAGIPADVGYVRIDLYEQLQAENEKLKAALEPFAKFACDDWETHQCYNCVAKQALKEK